MTGNELLTLSDEVNGGASIGATLSLQLLNLAKAMVEQQRPWMVLRDTDTSKTVTASTSAWQTAIDLSTIMRFNRFYGDEPIKNFDGTNRIDYFREVPFNKRLFYKDATGTFVFKHGSMTLYLNGSVNAGTLYTDYIKDSADIEANDDNAWTLFPTWAHPILAFIANGIHKGGIDFDDVNRLMAPDNRATAATIMAMLANWDNELQLAAQEQHDPMDMQGSGYRSGAIDMRA